MVLSHRGYSHGSWATLLVLCSTSSLLMRTVPALLTQLITKQHLPEPQPVQVRLGYLFPAGDLLLATSSQQVTCYWLPLLPNYV